MTRKPSFFKDLRRRSKSSFQTSKSSSESSNESNGSNGTVPTTKSTSTLNSTYGSNTPPPLTSQSSSNLSTFHNAPLVPPRPPIPASQRYSVSGMSGLGSPVNGKPYQPSMYAPRIVSIADGTMVSQKILSVYGHITENAEKAMDGTVTVSRLDDSFPPTHWPVCDSHFKALIYLTPGPNRLRFDFTSAKLANSGTSNPIHASYLTLHMIPATTAPPVHLVILLGRDSPAKFDSTPERIKREGNDLDTAIRKFRMAAYLWQAYTAEQMYRNRFGRRCFRYDEEWQTGTASGRDLEMGTMRSEAKIHVVRTEKTVAELRDPDLAQQNPNAKKGGDLYGIAADAVRNYFKPQPGQKQYVSVLILDAHWDKGQSLITGHAALGGGAGDIQLAIFGSQALHSYPSCFEEVVPAFTDCTPTDTNHVANDCNESGSNWEAANIGIGAHLHETGHLLGCPHQENGIMLRDYVTFDRSFITREPHSTRTKKTAGLVLPKDECTWHRLDLLRFKSHPCFALPGDAPLNKDDSPQAWPVENGNVIVTSSTGISFIEIRPEGDDTVHYWIEYGEMGSGIQRQIVLTEQEIRNKLPQERRKVPKINVSIKSVGGGDCSIEDFGSLSSKTSTIKLPNGQMGFRSKKLGFSQMEGTRPQETILESAMRQNAILRQVKVYHGFALDGVEFIYENSSSQMFGNRGGSTSEFNLDIRRGEYITGFNVRSGLWVDGIQLLTSLGRKSEFYGNTTGGGATTLMPPRGYTIAGISGTCGQWIDGLQVIITR